VAARELVQRKPPDIERANHIRLVGAILDDAADGDQDQAETGRRKVAYFDQWTRVFSSVFSATWR